MKNLLVRATKTPDGKIQCKIFRLEQGSEIESGDITLDEVQWRMFKAEAEWRNSLDGPHYEFESDWEEENSSAPHEQIGFKDRVSYRLIDRDENTGWGRPD